MAIKIEHIYPDHTIIDEPASVIHFARTLLPDPVGSSTYDAANRQLTFGEKTLTHDANGNLTSIAEPSATTALTWDVRNRLIGINGPGLTASFTYDAFDRRIEREINSQVARYLYDGADILQEFLDGTAVSYLHPLNSDEPLVRHGDEFYVADALGSTLALTDPAGTLQTQYTYEPFGRTGASGTSSSTFQFTGRENDSTGLYYYRARYYDPTLQRFISEDPIGFLGDINGYAYVGNNPLSRVDPLGLDWLNNAADFSAAAGSVLSFGLTDLANQGTGVNTNSGWYTAGTVTGIALTTAIGGVLGAEAAEANAGRQGFEFSHWIPDRMGGPRSIFNGNFVSQELHYLTDPFRYPSGYEAWGPKLNPVFQQILRIPWVYDAAAAGAVYGGVSAMVGRNSRCH